MQINLFTRMFTAALCIVPKDWKQCKHLTKKEWLSKLWYTMNRMELKQFLKII